MLDDNVSLFPETKPRKMWVINHPPGRIYHNFAKKQSLETITVQICMHKAHTNQQYSNTIITHVAYNEITYVENITRECFNLNLKIACSVSHFVFNILKGEKAMHVRTLTAQKLW